MKAGWFFRVDSCEFVEKTMTHIQHRLAKYAA